VLCTVAVGGAGGGGWEVKAVATASAAAATQSGNGASAHVKTCITYRIPGKACSALYYETVPH
jgi:hypothetical protein